MLKIKFKWFSFIPLFLFCALAFAAVPPLTMMQNVANETLSYLQKNKSHLKSNPALVHQLVNRVLVPHIDADRMAGAVVGRQYWQSATPAQRAQFIEQFKELVISTYSNAISSYDDDKVKFYPMRASAQQRAIQVRSVIIRKNGQQIGITYDLTMSNGQWKIYDFSIEGVSMVQSYRSQFNGVLAQGGLPLLLQRLIAHNRG